MINSGYNPGMAAGLLATAGSIGIIIPPSIAFVVYGAISETSVGKLFAAGVIPGIIMGIGLAVVAMFDTKRMPIIQHEKSNREEKLKAFKEAIWGLLMPVIILGGIYGGFFTATEAAAVAAVYGIIVGIFVYKKINFNTLVDLLIESAIGSAVVLFIVATATVFAWIVTTEGIAAIAGEAILNIAGGNKFVFLLLVNIILLIAGCFVDAISAFYLFVPILFPVAIELGYDPVAFGVLMTVNLAIGQVTPPVGVNLYVAAPMAKVNLKEITKGVIPYILISIVTLLLITYVPQFSLLLPNILGIK